MRSTETPLHMPSPGRALTVAWRALRLRCPNCGKGYVLSGFNSVHDHCAGCGFRFCRSDDNYFSGAMFFGILIGEALTVLGIGAAIWITYPNVKWDAITYGAPIVMFAVMMALFPLSRVVWLAVDVLIRPVQAYEMTKGA